MRKYLKPLIALVAGLVASYGLQAVGTPPLTAKLIGVAVAIVVFALFWRRSAAL